MPKPIIITYIHSFVHSFIVKHNWETNKHTGSSSESDCRLRRDWKWDFWRRPVFLVFQRVESNWSSASSDFVADNLCNCRYSVSSTTSIPSTPLLVFCPRSFCYASTSGPPCNMTRHRSAGGPARYCIGPGLGLGLGVSRSSPQNTQRSPPNP